MKIPGSKALRKGRLSVPGAVYLITKDVRVPGSKILLAGENPDFLIDWFFTATRRAWFNLLAFVVMPDHYHLVLVLGQKLPLHVAIGKVSENVSRRVKRALNLQGSIWQTGFHDHLIRPSEDVQKAVDYVHLNPVKAGLVGRPEDWMFSSVHRKYAGRVKIEFGDRRGSQP